MKKLLVFKILILFFVSGVKAGTIPPCAISDLTALTGSSQGEVNLSWTAPGDDGAGGGDAAGYVVKYATFPITGANFYDSNISTFTQSWTPAAAGTGDSGTVTGLTPAVTFYFAVKAYDDGIPSINYASWSTTTVNALNSADAYNEAPGSFNLTYPTVELIISTDTPSFDWQDASDPGDTITYTIIYSSYSDFSVSVSSVGVSSSTYKPVTGLQENATYWWNVRCIDLGGLTTYTSTTTFHVNVNDEQPASFDLTSPSDASGDASQTPVFDWEDAVDVDPGDTVSYTLWYSSYSNFSTSTTVISISTSTHTPGTDLDENTTYWWYVRAIDSDSLTRVSDSTFSVVINGTDEPPGSFDLLSPADGSMEQSTKKPSFDWQDSSDPDPGDTFTYTVWYSTMSDFSVKTTSAGITISSFTPSVDLIEDATYWWSVRAIDSDTLETVSTSTRTVNINTTDDSPDSFNLTTPVSWQVVNTLRPLLDWDDAVEPDADDSISKYRVDWAQNVIFTQNAGFADNVLISTYTITYDLAENTTYWWKVTAYDGALNLTVSSTTTFRINATEQYPASFNLTAPADGNIETTQTPAFDWDNTSDPDPGDSLTYTIVYSSYNNFSVQTSSVGLVNSNYTPSADLDENATYWWSARAVDSTARTKVSNSTRTIRINATDEVPASFDLLSPTTGQIVTTLTPSFDWEDTTDPDPGDTFTFTVWYSTMSDFSVKTTSAGITISSFTPTSSLIENATYWWSVRAVDSDTLETVSNSTFTLHVNSANNNPNSFNLLLPPDTSSFFDLTPALSWETATDPDPGDSIASYTLQYSTEIGFGSYTEINGISGTSQTIASNLTNNETYYWKVKAIDSNAGETWATAFQFYTDNNAPGAFTLSWPADGDIITTLTPTINWNDSTDPDAGDSVTYSLIYSSYSGFSSSATVTGLGSSQWVVSPALDENTTYWYKARAYDTNGFMTETSVFDFQTNNNDQFPAAFTLLSSSGIVTSKRPIFDWQDAPDPDPGDTVLYTLYYSSYSSFSTSTTVTTLSTSTHTPGTDLLENATYWWFVKAQDNDGYAVWSSTWQIRINEDDEYPAAFNLQTPLTGTTVQTATPVFDWNDTTDPDPGDTISYTILYDTDPSFSSPTTVPGLPASTYTPGTDLTENAAYWWNVRAVDSDTLYTVGNTTFTIKINAVDDPPDPFSLSSPADASVSTSTSVAFTWNGTIDPDPGGTVTYTLIYSTYAGFTSSTVVTGITGTTTSYTLNDNLVYYWKVVAVDSTTQTTESSFSYYVTVNTADEKPASFDLLLPSTGTVVNTRTPFFDWQDSSDVDPWDTFTYTVKYSLTSDFSAFTSSAGLAVSQYTPASNLNENATYWWSVTAVDSGSLTTVSNSTFYFRINEINDPPLAFDLTSPANSTTVPSTTTVITFVWQTSVDDDPGGSVTYQLVYSTDAAFTPNTTISNIPTATTTQILNDNTIYYWKVIAVDSTTITTESTSSWTFTIDVQNELPGSFNLTYPADGGIVSVLKPTFDWEDADPVDPRDNITYTIMYSVDPALPIINRFVEQNLTSSDYTPSTDLVNNTTYYWKIIAYDKPDPNPPYTRRSVESNAVFTFLVIRQNEPPGAFNLSSPAHGAQVSAVLPLFSWEKSIDPNPDDTPVYVLYYSTYSSMASSRAISNISGAQYQLTSANILSENTVYYWRVKAYDDEAAETFSSGIFSFSIPVLTIPAEVLGVKGSLVQNGNAFEIRWEAVTTNTNGTSIDDLAGYAIYTSDDIEQLGSGSPKGSVDSANLSWIDTSISRNTMYYTVRAVDASGIEGRNSLAIELSEEENLIVLSSDNTVALTIPKNEGNVFYEDTSPYGDNMKIDIARVTADEGGFSGRVLRSFDMNLVDSRENTVNGFSFSTPIVMSFNYKDAVQNAPGITTLADASYGVGLFWHNGVEFVKIGGRVNTADNTISITTKQLGKYQLMNVMRATSFEFVQVWPKKIFTPNRDGINDEINFLFENPKLSVLTGKVYDIHGAYVADLAPGADPFTSLVWDGKGKGGGSVRKGIYIFQIKCEGKVYNGTVVVAR